MEEATVAKWHKQPGDSFQTGDILYEIETEKVTQEVEATGDGTLLEVSIPEGRSPRSASSFAWSIWRRQKRADDMDRALVTATAHTGVTVSDIDRSIAFYRDVLGFEVTEKIICRGELFEQVTGVPKAEIVIAYVKAPGHTLELLQYTSPGDRARVSSRPCDPGALHLAFRVKNIEGIVAAAKRAGMTPVSASIPEVKDGPSKGVKAIYTRDPDGVVIEFMEDPRIRD
jgi:catechol 2,3-dioxygenase-like lactoylglutathione lyase family enzyme